MIMTKFLRDMLVRFLAKSPKFFVVIQWAGWILAFVVGLPEYLVEQGIDLPQVVDGVIAKVVGWAGVALGLVAKLPVNEEDRVKKAIA